jgi:hypothetical protein
VIVSVITLCLPAVGAGQQADTQANQPQNGQGSTQGQPLAPVSAGGTAQNPEGAQTAPTVEDARSFGGAEASSIRSPGSAHGYFLPSFEFSEMADSNFEIGGGPQRFEAISTLMGRLDYQKSSRHSTTTVEFIGGGSIYNHHSELNSTSEQFGISHSYQGRRWSFLFDDRASYLPESPYGYGGFGFMGALGQDLGGASGSNLSNLNPAFSSSQTLLTGRGPRVLNTTVGQMQYKVGSRSSITLSGSYGLLHFREPGFIDTRNSYILFGYNHSISARDNVGVSYGYSMLRYHNLPQSVDTHLLQITYGHRVSGRLAVHFGAGPQFLVIKNPISGSSTSNSWAASSSLDYQHKRQAISLSYNRGTNNGGGVLIGAITDDVRASWSTEFARRWSWSLSPGYAHNRSLSQTTAGNAEIIFNTEYAEVSLSRKFGRNTSMFFTYNFQNQRSDTVPCVLGNCMTGLHRNVFGFGFDFHPRQISND